jgi:hypothetical protein
MNVKPIKGITQSLRIVLIVTVIVSVLSIGVDYLSYRDYSALPYNVDFDEIFFLSEALSFIIGLFGLVSAFVFVVLFMIWIYRLNKNLHALSDMSMKYTPGWSVGWFFIPLANFILPYKVVKEIWHVSHKDFSVSRAIVRWWWVLYLLESFASSISARVLWRVDTAGAFANSAIISIISEAFAIIVNLIALTLVTRIGNAYKKNYGEEGKAVSGDTWALPANL